MYIAPSKVNIKINSIDVTNIFRKNNYFISINKILDSDKKDNVNQELRRIQNVNVYVFYDVYIVISYRFLSLQFILCDYLCNIGSFNFTEH